MSVFERALADHRAGRLTDAAAGYRRLLDEDPNHADACHLLGVTLYQRGEHGLAAAMIGRAIELSPRTPNYHNSLGLALHGAGDYDAALESWRFALSLDAQDADIHNNIGMVLSDMRRFADAEPALRQALELRPDYPAALNNLGRVLIWKGCHDDAVSLLRQACELAGNDATYWNSLGVALRERGDYDAATRALTRAMEIAPNLADAHVNLAQILLLHGDAAGWREQEWRLRHPRHAARDANRYWAGADIAGRTVLLWAEQGLGDAIQFIRYAPLVAARGARVVVECRESLHRLFQEIDGVAEVVAPGDRPAHDAHAPLMSLPHIMPGVSATDPYIPAPAARPLESQERSRRIGLVWAGNSDHANDRNRSYRLAEFAPLGTMDAAFFALQTGPPAAQPGAGKLAVTRLGDGFADFADTAAAIMAMDLVIGVDTAVAHLAGALGKPVWVILPPNPDWRWGTDGETTAWYRSMRLFRRARGEDRAAVVARVAKALAAL